MRRTILIATGLLLVAVTAYVTMLVIWTLREGPGTGSPGGPVGAARRARVAEALTADRLRLDSGEEIRLAAIEVPAPGEPLAEEGRQASQALAGGQAVRLVGPPEATYLYLPEGPLLQELLVSGGYARVAEGAPDDEVVAALQQSEAEARSANLGLWAGDARAARVTPFPTSAPIECVPSLVPGESIGPGEAAERLGETVNVVFLPTRLTERNGTITLMAGVTEEDFGVFIPTGLASTVDEPGLVFLNRCIVVTGRIERDPVRSAPRITLRDFEQVLVLR